MNSNGHYQLMSLWSIQDGLLQSYRGLFITAESIVSGFAAAVATTDSPLIVFSLAGLGVVIMVLWIKICGASAKDVSFVQWLILKVEKGDTISQPLLAFKTFQDKGTFNETIVHADSEFLRLNDSATRRSMQITMPLCFGLFWILILYVPAKQLLNGYF